MRLNDSTQYFSLPNSAVLPPLILSLPRALANVPGNTSRQRFDNRFDRPLLYKAPLEHGKRGLGDNCRLFLKKFEIRFWPYLWLPKIKHHNGEVIRIRLMVTILVLLYYHSLSPWIDKWWLVQCLAIHLVIRIQTGNRKCSPSNSLKTQEGQWLFPAYSFVTWARAICPRCAISTGFLWMYRVLRP